MSNFAIYPFHFGFFKIEYDKDIVIAIKKLDSSSFDSITNKTLEKKSFLTDTVYSQINEYLDGSRKTFNFPYELRGTEFQKKVWTELCKIPYGETRTYKDIAVAIGNPKASRAVGMANNKNPIIIAVPCHRVIGANGSLTGYAGGLGMKAALLSLEATGTL